jgi:hypothetical protein
MVYRDLSDEKNNSYGQLKPPVLRASLIDRFFSFLIDYLVLSPFVSFILLMLFQGALSYWKLNPNAPEQYQITFILCISYAIFFSLLQSFFIFMWKATPGQYFLKIYIEFENDQNFLFWRAFLRQFGFCITILLLGMPWMALMTHPLQKTFYDRLADARVYSKKKSSAFLTFEFESLYWRSFSATFMIFVGLMLFVFVFSKYDEVKQRIESYKVFEKRNFFCSEIKNVKESSRLQLALAMNLVGQLSDDCLDREADFVLWKVKTEEIELAYFAKAMTEESHENEMNYLKTACETEEKSFGCQLAQAFLTADFDKLYIQLKQNKSLLAKTLSYEFSQILEKPDETKTNFAQLKKFDNQKLVKKYLITEILTSQKNQSLRSLASIDEDDQSELEEQALELLKEL